VQRNQTAENPTPETPSKKKRCKRGVQRVQTCIESFINLLQRSIDTSGYHPLKALIRKAWNKSPSFAINNNLCLQNAQKTNKSQQHPLLEWKAEAKNKHKIKKPTVLDPVRLPRSFAIEKRL
jgi:hypothetical protein